MLVDSPAHPASMPACTKDSLTYSTESIAMLESCSSMFVTHAGDVEDLQKRPYREFVQRLGEWYSIPVTYASRVNLQRSKT